MVTSSLNGKCRLLCKCSSTNRASHFQSSCSNKAQISVGKKQSHSGLHQIFSSFATARRVNDGYLQKSQYLLCKLEATPPHREVFGAATSLQMISHTKSQQPLPSRSGNMLFLPSNQRLPAGFQLV